MEQRTDEWKKARLGKVTASRIGDALAVLKNGTESARRSNYRLELIAERITGMPIEIYENSYMRWGNEYEGMARMIYGQRKSEMVEETGFILHPTLDAGASPDGLVGENGLVEIKCPSTQTHLTYILNNTIPDDYRLQMAWQIVCTGREWCDFASFDPRLPDDLCLHVIRYAPDASELAAVEKDVSGFLDTVDDMMNYLAKVAKKNGERDN